MKKCNNCGAELLEDSVFCDKCGSNDISVIDEQQDNMQFCRYCGNKITLDSEFCNYCGKPVNQVTEIKKVETINVPKKDSSVTPVIDVVESKQTGFRNANDQEKKKKNPFKRFLSWIVMIAVFIVAIILFQYIIDFCGKILDIVEKWPVIVQIIAFLLGGATTLLGLIIAPIWYGIPALVALSDMVYESEKGTRYLVFGIIIAIDYLWSFISIIINYQRVSMSHLVVGLAGVALAFFRNKLYKKY